jgi:opacity protein-like surface antigen
MKKLYILLIISITTFSFSSGQFTKIGGGLNFGTGFHFHNVTAPAYEEVFHRGPFAGIYLKGIYEIKPSIHISPSFTYFIPRTNKGLDYLGFNTLSTRVSAMMFDLNGHYIFNSLDRFEFYVLAGLNITLTKLKWLDSGSTSPIDNALGFNIGAGSYLKLTEQLDLNAEFKAIFPSKYPQLMLNVGLLINLDWLKKNENPGK